MEFVYIAPGTFIMGSPETEKERETGETQHQVSLTKGYWLQTTPVTQGQWESLMGSNPPCFTGCGSDCPVESVSWDDAQGFIQELNSRESGMQYRLPTEAESEYACRAGSTSVYCYGDNKSRLSDYIWFKDNSDRKTHPVGLKRANTWGLYDMHGSVFEWCLDWYDEYSSGAVTDPVGPPSGQLWVSRGGGWVSGARHFRSANRNRRTPGYRYTFLIFRLARNQ